jgi:hypothetical protein
MGWGAAGAAIASGIGAIIEIAQQVQSDHGDTGGGTSSSTDPIVEPLEIDHSNDVADAWGGAVADWIDRKTDNTLGTTNTESFGVNFILAVGEELLHGIADMFRFGEGIGNAIYNTQGDWLDKAAVMAPDFGRGGQWLLAGAGGLKLAAGKGPWLGGIKYEGPHAGGPHQYPHLQLMLRTGKHQTSKWYIKLGADVRK